MLRGVAGLVLPDISAEGGTLIRNVGEHWPLTQHNIPEELNSHQHRYGTLRPLIDWDKIIYLLIKLIDWNNSLYAWKFAVFLLDVNISFS
jgi:hypothetical protein